MKISSTLIVIIFAYSIAAQTLFYEDQFKGGATASGGSPGAYATYTPSDFEIFIPLGSTIRKAYLFAGRHGDAPDTEVDLNGIVYTFDETNQVSDDFYSVYGGSAGVHAIDITSDIDPVVSDYTLEVVDSYYGPNNIYLDFYLFVTYDNPSLDSTFVVIYLNNQDFDDAPDDPWEVFLPQPMDTACTDIAVAFMTGYACYMSDGEDAYVNDIYIGTWGGNEDNSGDCGGPLGSFAYSEGELTGLMDDDEDEVVDETDVIATINEYITVGSTYLELNFDYVGALYYGESSNAIWAAAIIYGEGSEFTDSILTVSDDATICLGESINLFAEGDGEISWSPAIGLDDPESFEPVATPDTTTVYIATLEQACFEAVDTVIITVDDSEIELPNDFILCYGDESEIGVEAIDGINYIWSPDLYLDNNEVANPITSPEETIVYTLVATTSNGCISEASIEITISNPEVDAGPNIFAESGNTVELSASGSGGDYVWYPAVNLTCDTCLITQAEPEETITYSIEIIDENGCTDSDSVTVFIFEDCRRSVKVPNVFSPNGDGLNDFFNVIVYDDRDVSGIMQIYNRWGKLVFETTDILKGWNGTIEKSDTELVGTYIYNIVYNCDGDVFEKTGNVILLK